MPRNPAPEPQALTVAEFLAAYRIGRSTLYEEIKAGRIEVRKIGKRTLIPAESARTWFESLPKSAA